eukprot:CAMPEP_0175880190 /NCGR_PEP_ID=MMETSP0107_2-20121207/42180_1 /TAXON_ID=195067 ORGANISM="Goniomonas pacifica, Strain CCMP1869" /NCGR_SAMPLE_ID=MMETSP0107_2 /ASSEMBLY_ACC=CAM_ASM_000203 /LENGTH=32 /DNA_ID= /DNA_START= /DNA_END= /DNA_ORIENTATION=
MKLHTASSLTAVMAQVFANSSAMSGALLVGLA